MHTTKDWFLELFRFNSEIIRVRLSENAWPSRIFMLNQKRNSKGNDYRLIWTINGSYEGFYEPLLCDQTRRFLFKNTFWFCILLELKFISKLVVSISRILINSKFVTLCNYGSKSEMVTVMNSGSFFVINKYDWWRLFNI